MDLLLIALCLIGGAACYRLLDNPTECGDNATDWEDEEADVNDYKGE